MQRPDNELQARIRECENPTFGYRRGEDGEIEKDIFNGYIPHGWVDSPADVGDMPPTPHVQPGPPVGGGPVDSPESPPEPAPDDSALAPPYEDHPFNVLRAEFKRRTGKVAAKTTSKPDYIRLLQALDEGKESDADADA